MSITSSDQIRFQERLYDHIREEMIIHIKHRRAVALAVFVGYVALLAWLWSEGKSIAADFPILQLAPWFVLLLGAGSIEATNSKIRVHNAYLKKIEKRYQEAKSEDKLIGLFDGFEKYYETELENSQFPSFVSERLWLRAFLIFLFIWQVLISVGG